MKKKVKVWLMYLAASTMIALTMGVLYICLSSGDDTQKMNNCLQKHDINYCNKEVK